MLPSGQSDQPTLATNQREPPTSALGKQCPLVHTAWNNQRNWYTEAFSVSMHTGQHHLLKAWW